MFEEKTQDVILQAMLDNAAAMSDVDLTEGSFTSNALSVAAMAIEDAYQDAETVMANALPDSCDREHLIRFAEARGMEPYPASAARYGVTCNVELPVGFRLTDGLLNFTVTEAGTSAVIQCDTAGTEGNTPTIGESLDAIDYIDGFESCSVTSIVARGTDEEDTEGFRARYLAAIDVSGQFGNEAFYSNIAQGVHGIGKTLVVYDEDKVNIYLLAEGNALPSTAQVAEVQQTAQEQAPVGHTVEAYSPHIIQFDMEATGITPASENTAENQDKIRRFTEEYFFEDRKNFGKNRVMYWSRLTAYVLLHLEQSGSGITSLTVNRVNDSPDDTCSLFSTIFLSVKSMTFNT